LHILAGIRANVNDSEPVDAFGKVENQQSKPPVFSRSGKREGEELKTAQPAEQPLRKQIRSNPAIAYSSFFTVTFTFALISR
jgi:hypothetical protein